jgi:RNA polymerase sigma-70 factor (ECF subfamily)
MKSDQQLIADAKSDKAEFIHLYDKYFTQIFKYVLSRVQDEDLAEDITAETFMRALEKIDSYKWTGNPYSSFLYKVAINLIMDYHREVKKEKEFMSFNWEEMKDGRDEIADHLKDSEEELEDLDKTSRLKIALENLKPKERNLISLKYFEDLSYKEMAEVLNVNVNYVGVQLNRAMKKLTKLCNY